jgi:hypothetical protein
VVDLRKRIPSCPISPRCTPAYRRARGGCC